MASPAIEQQATSDELGRAISRSVLKGVFVLLVLLVALIVQVTRHGAQLRYLFLAGGALVSGATLLLYALFVAARLRGDVRKGWIPMLLAFSGLVPYLFGVYLAIYEGLWRLLALRHGFSLGIIALSISFAIGGYVLVSATHRLSDVSKFRRIVVASDAA